MLRQNQTENVIAASMSAFDTANSTVYNNDDKIVVKEK